MTKLIITLGLIIAFALLIVQCSSAAEAPQAPAKKEVYYSGGLSLDLFGTVRTVDLQRSRLGNGIGLQYYFDQNFGIGAEAIQENYGHGTLDESNAYLLYRIPVKASALYFFAGGGRHWHDGDYGILFGGGVEHRIARKVSLFGDARLDKVLDHAAGAMGRLGLRFHF